MEILDTLIKYLPFIIPLVVLQCGLQIFAWIDIARKKRTKNLSILIWVLITLLISTLGIGSLLYLMFGRAENIYED